MSKWILGEKLSLSEHCWPSHPKFYSTNHFQSTIHIHLHFNCTWSGSLDIKKAFSLQNETWRPTTPYSLKKASSVDNIIRWREQKLHTTASPHCFSRLGLLSSRKYILWPQGVFEAILVWPRPLLAWKESHSLGWLYKAAGRRGPPNGQWRVTTQCANDKRAANLIGKMRRKQPVIPL